MEMRKKGKCTTIKRAIYKYIKTHPRTIREIAEYLAGKYKYAPDYHGLCSIMGKSGYFKKVGCTDVETLSGGYYKAVLWTVD